jgi:hypothetical protein
MSHDSERSALGLCPGKYRRDGIRWRIDAGANDRVRKRRSPMSVADGPDRVFVLFALKRDSHPALFADSSTRGQSHDVVAEGPDDACRRS